MVGALHDCGICQNTGMGRTGLTWIEVQAYSSMTGIDLTGWEAQQVIRMSRAYCSMVSEATETRQIKAPWEPELTEEDIYNRGLFASGKADRDLDIESYI